LSRWFNGDDRTLAPRTLEKNRKKDGINVAADKIEKVYGGVLWCSELTYKGAEQYGMYWFRYNVTLRISSFGEKTEGSAGSSFGPSN